jgi:hypothetical protein
MAETAAEKLAKEVSEQDVPEDVSAWLGRLVLLYGIPFHYLIPEEGMLPGETIRFFYLDPIWIQCAIQGACSVGSTDYGDTIVDNAMNSLVQAKEPASGKNAGSVTRKAAVMVRDRLREQCEGIAAKEDGRDLAWPLTGFLLRSSVVQGWRGLEIMAYKAIADEAERRFWEAKDLKAEVRAKVKEGFAPLQPLRIEQLSSEVMLGIFNGLIAQLVARQPQEGLHFGLTREAGSLSKTMRKLGYKNAAEAGNISQQDVIDLAAKNLTRVQAQKGVIKVAALAAEIKSQLAAMDEFKDRFTSAEFAAEMIEAPGEFTFKVPLARP